MCYVSFVGHHTSSLGFDTSALPAKIDKVTIFDEEGYFFRGSNRPHADFVKSGIICVPLNGSIVFENIRNCTKLSIEYIFVHRRGTKVEIESIQCRDVEYYRLDLKTIGDRVGTEVKLSDRFDLHFHAKAGYVGL